MAEKDSVKIEDFLWGLRRRAAAEPQEQDPEEAADQAVRKAMARTKKEFVLPNNA